jgi:hypothetical protein
MNAERTINPADRPDDARGAVDPPAPDLKDATHVSKREIVVEKTNTDFPIDDNPPGDTDDIERTA